MEEWIESLGVLGRGSKLVSGEGGMSGAGDWLRRKGERPKENIKGGERGQWCGLVLLVK